MKLKSLIIKDIYMMIKYCKLHFISLFIFIGIYIFDESQFIFLFYPCIFFSALPITLLSYDKHSKWNEYALTMPIKKSDLVISKYIVGILTYSVMMILTLFAITVKEVLNRTFNANTIIVFLSILITVYCLSTSVNLPFVFRFGIEKGRLAYFVSMGVFAGLTAMTVTSDIGNKTFLSISKLATIPGAIIVAMVISVIILCLTCFISVKGFEKNKEL